MSSPWVDLRRLRCLCVGKGWGAGRVPDCFLLGTARTPEQEECNGDSEPGKNRGGEERGLVTLGQGHKRIRVRVGSQIVVGPGDRDGGDDGGADRSAHLEG